MKVKINCKQCSKEFASEYKYLRRGQGLFCTQSCATAHSNSRKDRILERFVVRCTACNKSIEKKRLSRTGKYFCNKECNYDFNRKHLMKQCIICRKEFQTKTDRVYGRQKKICSDECLNKWKLKRTDRLASPLTTEQKLRRKHSVFLRKHKNTGIKVDFATEHLVDLWKNQEGKCYYTGEEMVLEASNGGQPPNQCSVDRVDPTKGYIEGNIVLCSYWINSAKQQMAIEDLKRRCQMFLDRR